MKKYPGSFIGMCVLMIVLTFSCSSDDSLVIYEQGTNEYANSWTYQQMKRYYFWNAGMPSEGNLSLNPKEYFQRLLNAEDRFSYTLHPAVPDSYPKSVRRAFGFDVAFVDHSGQVYGVILYVLSGSPAQNTGLRRGLCIRSVNGTRLTLQNYETLYGDLIKGGTIRLELMEFDSESGFSAPYSINISQAFTFLQPIEHKVIVQGSNRIGYINIPHFDIGIAQALIPIFQEFQYNSINKLVVDLRYNGGGDVSSAAALCTILAPSIQPNDLFITFKGNRNGGIIQQSFKQAVEMNESNVSFQALRDVHPPIQKLYILCGKHTASASEIIINNMKPFIDVVTIGEKTLGKDVAGFAINDDRIAGQTGWTLYPSIYKLYNTAGEGGYSTGIIPTIELNELEDLEVYPLGDPREMLLQKALTLISSNNRNLDLHRVSNTISLPNHSIDEGTLMVINH